MQFVRRFSTIGKGLLLTCLLIAALMGFTATSASAASVQNSAIQHQAAPHTSPLNAGGCPSGDYCLWHGTNFTGVEYANSAPNCTETSIGFVGVFSYANYSSFTVEVDYVNQQNEIAPAFYILPGHTSINTSANPKAKDAKYVYVC
jgi:hypothetical protein